jgi:hypothetical protein
MDRKFLYAGLTISIAGLLLNQCSLLLLNMQDPIIPGIQPHSRPPILFTSFLFLIPFGFLVIIYHFWLKARLDSQIVSPFQEQTIAE